jgi:hypothetical protein
MLNDVVEKLKALKEEDTFLVTVTTRNNDTGNLDTSLYSNNFYYVDMDGTKDMIAKLMEEEKKEGGF